MRGRKPKPTFLKVLAGNPGRQRLNWNEPVPQTNLTDAPSWLTWLNPAALQIWNDVRANIPAGLLKHVDCFAFARWCQKAEEYGRVAAELDGLKDPYGLPAEILRSILDNDHRVLRQLETELGFTPAARPRLQVAPEPDEKSPFEKLMG